MFSHITIGSNDMARSAAFYDAALAPLGIRAIPQTHPDFRGYAPGGERTAPWVSICRPFDGGPATPGNGFHVAWVADSADAVRAFHAAALAAGGTDEGAPGLRPHYAADYFGAYVRDPDGTKIQAVHFGEGRTQGPGGRVLSHVCLPVDDPTAGAAFYAPVLAALGLERLTDEETPGEDCCFGHAGVQVPVVFIQRPFDGKPAVPGNGQHAAFLAPSRAAVDAFHRAALAGGGVDDGAPGDRPHYGDPYYAAYVRDIAGNKIQAVCRTVS
jgi:catechol 2,3-dioxygenase-like lactoylglutathione lyase family enzyme